MISSDSDSDIDSSGQGNEPSLNSEGVGPGGVPRKRGAKRNELEDGEVDDSEGDPEAKQTRKRHRVSSGSKKADAGDRARYLVDDEAEESGDEVGSDEDEESDGSGVEGEDEYLKDGFVVADDGSVGGSGSEQGSDVEFTRRKKKLTRLRRTHDEGGILDDDDIMLLQESHAQKEGVEHDHDQQAALRAVNARDLESQLFSGPPGFGEEEGDHAKLGGSTAIPRQPFREDDYQSEEEDDFIEDDIAMYTDDKLRRAASYDIGAYGEAGGPTPDQLLEAMEIFGEGIVEHMKGQQPSITRHEERARISVHAPKSSAVPHVEPGKLQESFISPQDKIIQTKDWPERLQSRLVSDEAAVAAPETADKWKKESTWIYSKIRDVSKKKAKPLPLSTAASNDTGWGGGGGVEEIGWGEAAIATTEASSGSDSQEQKIIRIIESILILLRVEGMEVPFIFNHRPDSFKPELNLVDLWHIYDLDEKWESLILRRQNISRISNALWNKAEKNDEKVAVGDASVSTTMGHDTMKNEDGNIEKSLLPILKDTLNLFPKELYGKFTVENDDETLIRDLQAYLSLVTFRNKFAVSSERKPMLHRAARQDQELYRRYRHIPELRKFALSFSLPAHQLGSFLVQRDVAIPPPTPVRPPDVTVMGLGHKCGLQTDNAALQAVLTMLAQEIAGEPRILSRCRQIFRERATLSTFPTDLGKQEIDYFHPLYGIHYIHQKPVLELLNVNGSNKKFHAGSPLSDPRVLFMLLERGRKDGLIIVKINPPLCLIPVSTSTTTSVTDDTMGLDKEQPQEVDLLPFMFELAPLYGARKEITSGSEWEVVRSRVLEIALRHMMPQLIVELIRELRYEANNCVAEKVSEALAARLCVAPWTPDNRTAEENLTNDPEKRRTLDEIRVVGIHVSPDPSQPSYAAVIDPSGVPLDHLILPARREEVPIKLKEFLMDSRPHVVVVGASPSQQTRYIKRMLYAHRSAQLEGDPDLVQGVIPEALEDYKNRREEESVTWYPEWAACSVEYVREDVALVFSASVRSEQEMPDTHPNHRAAVCLARYLQNPLIELAGMWMTMDSQGELGSEMLSLQFHPLQKEIPRRRLLCVLEQRMIDFVNMVGVDVNSACKLEHMGGLIQFVAGLGPRKALRLKSGILALPEGVIHSRQQFLQEHLLGPHVYTNASATLRIRPGIFENDERLNPFDDTRIHPECYTKHMWARQICANALDIDGDDYISNFHAVMDDSNEALVATLQHNEHWDPASSDELQDKLEELDLEEFASDMERQGLGMRQLQLEAIKNEIRFPYRELRRPFESPTSDQLFEWIIGETDMTLRLGVVLPVRIIGHTRNGMKAKVEGFSCLYGFIRIDTIPDSHMMDEIDLQRTYPRNHLLDAVAIDVAKDRFEVLLSLQPEDVTCDPFQLPSRFPRPSSLPPIDNHFNEYRAIQEVDARKKEREKLLDENRRGRKFQVGSNMLTASKLISRFRAHDNFRACTYSEAEDSLRDGAVGDIVIRPSSKGVDYLGLTWMWLPNSFKHVDIHGKAEVDDRLVLWIEGEEYEDLDEVLARYITPCNDYISDVLLNEKYREGSREDCQKYLEEQKKSQQSRIPYLITKHHSAPAHFVLMYLPGKTLKSEYVKVMPGGYEMGKELFSNIKTLIRYFKTNIQEKVMLRQKQQEQVGGGHYSTTAAPRMQQNGPGGFSSNPPLPPGPPPSALLNAPRNPHPPPSGMDIVQGRKVQTPIALPSRSQHRGYSRYQGHNRR